MLLRLALGQRGGGWTGRKQRSIHVFGGDSSFYKSGKIKKSKK
jgi:hypothetical protein